jgi:hypothetical protein
MASGRCGFLAAAAFGIAEFHAAHDLAGVLAHAAGGRSLSPIGCVRAPVKMVQG